MRGSGLDSETGQQPLTPVKPTALTAAQLAHVELRLTVSPKIRGTDLFGELDRDCGLAGSYPSFQRQLRRLRPAVVRDPEVQFETGPGCTTFRPSPCCRVNP